MGFPRQQAFAYHHKVSATGNLDKGKFVEQIWHKVVVEHRDTFVVVQSQHKLADEDLDKLVADQTQHKLADQVHVEVGIAGIVAVCTRAAKAIESTVVVVGTTVVDLTVVVAHQCKVDQVVNTLHQCKFVSFQ